MPFHILFSVISTNIYEHMPSGRNGQQGIEGAEGEAVGTRGVRVQQPYKPNFDNIGYLTKISHLRAPSSISNRMIVQYILRNGMRMLLTIIVKHFVSISKISAPFGSQR